MRHDRQPDLIHNSDANLARASRIAADHALLNPYEPLDARERRRDQMLAEAEKYERLAAMRRK